MVGPGARKPSVGEGIESRRPLFLSFSLSLSFFFTPILVCEITIIITIIINKISEWSKTYHMHFNPAKCKCMLLTQKGNPHSHALTLNGEILEMVSQYRYLGVTISLDLPAEDGVTECCICSTYIIDGKD